MENAKITIKIIARRPQPPPGDRIPAFLIRDAHKLDESLGRRVERAALVGWRGIVDLKHLILCGRGLFRRTACR